MKSEKGRLRLFNDFSLINCCSPSGLRLLISKTRQKFWCAKTTDVQVLLRILLKRTMLSINRNKQVTHLLE